MDINDVLSHELAPIPTSLFTEVGEMRISKAKSVLKKQLQAECQQYIHQIQTSLSSMDSSALGGSLANRWDSGGVCEQFQRSHRKATA